MTDSNPLFRRAANRGEIGHGKVSEKRVAKSLAARLTPASGATKGAKGDARLKAEVDFLLESKSTTSDTMRIDLGWLVKIRYESLAKGIHPAVSVSFVTGEGGARPHGDWVMIPMSVFRELTET